jgi:hypothetical protein
MYLFEKDVAAPLIDIEFVVWAALAFVLYKIAGSGRARSRLTSR